jgi:selenium metabolism protein YedF
MNDLTILITRAQMGQADPALGEKLIVSYLGLLDLEDRLPRRICFYGEGVRLVCEGSPVLDELLTLASRGVELIACGTCLGFYGLTKEMRVGREGNMREIIGAQFDAARVVTI